MCYCSLFKVKCCEDVIEEMHQMRINISEVGKSTLNVHMLLLYVQRDNWLGLLKYVYEEMIIIAKVSLLFFLTFAPTFMLLCYIL